MNSLAFLFPEESRHLAGQRWIKVVLRTLHLVGLAGIGGGYLYATVDDTWRLYLFLTLITGGLMTLYSIWSNGIWFLQLRGQVILLKLVLLGLIVWWPAAGPVLLMIIVILSGWISHAPGRVRYYSFYHGQRLDSLYDADSSTSP